MMAESNAPVFIVGSPRSGTTYLYHLLVSSRGFADFRAEMHTFDLIGPKFNQLRRLSDVEEFLDNWLEGGLFQLTGLDKETLRDHLLKECRSQADFLRIVMEDMAKDQGIKRWAECTPENALHLRTIAKHFPNARILHIIRDGRDVALSMERQRWIKPLPFHKHSFLLASLFYWQWVVSRARATGAKLPQNYLEVRYENLVSDPRDMLAKIAQFIDHELDYDQIQQMAIGSVSSPNTSFSEQGDSHSPVGRWKKQLSIEQRLAVEAASGRLLQELGYEAIAEKPSLWSKTKHRLLASGYSTWFSAKHRAKMSSFFGKRSSGEMASGLDVR